MFFILDARLEVSFTLPNGELTQEVLHYTDSGHPKEKEHLLQYLKKKAGLDVFSLERIPLKPLESHPEYRECGFIVHIYVYKLEDYDKATDTRFSGWLNWYFHRKNPRLVKCFSCNYDNGHDCERHFGREPVS